MPHDQSLRDAAEAALASNRAAGRRVALAESCTGGMVCAALTDIAGSSDVMSAGFVTYSDESKYQMLGVSSEIIETFGAVSPGCAWAMAAGALERSDADVAVAITGIAGPGGGSINKPVGTVVFARAHRGQSVEEIFIQRVHFDATERSAIRRAATLFALDLLHADRDGLVSSTDIILPAP